MSATHDDENFNNSSNPSFNDVLDARLTRRDALRVSVGTAGAAVLGSLPLAGCGGSNVLAAAPAADPAASAAMRLSFPAVAKSTADTVQISAGYTATVLYALGDPLTAATPDFKNDGTDTDFDNRAGDHHDGMEYFGLNAAGTARDPAGSARGLLAMNHEALTDQFLHAAGSTPNPRPAAEADKEIAAHGVSIVEVRKVGGKFAYQKGSTYNRRVTPMTPIQINRPGPWQRLDEDEVLDRRHRRPRHDQQLRHRLHALGHLRSPARKTGPATSAAATTSRLAAASPHAATSRWRAMAAPQNSASRHGWETAGADDKYARWDITQTGASADGTRRLPQRAQHLRLHGRDRSLRQERRHPQAHRPGPLRARKRRLRQARGGQAGGRLHGRRLARRVHLQVRLHRQLGRRRRQRRPTASPPATSTWTAASSTSRSTAPTAPASGSS